MNVQFTSCLKHMEKIVSLGKIALNELNSMYALQEDNKKLGSINSYLKAKWQHLKLSITTPPHRHSSALRVHQKQYKQYCLGGGV